MIIKMMIIPVRYVPRHNDQIQCVEKSVSDYRFGHFWTFSEDVFRILGHKIEIFEIACSPLVQFYLFFGSIFWPKFFLKTSKMTKFRSRTKIYERTVLTTIIIITFSNSPTNAKFSTLIPDHLSEMTHRADIIRTR